ncbi:MAG: hypothetical protein IJ375_01055 [Oscillospiraceae bacterium]|nr:hypothetical protein [Oscillospiraceae bacterium]
MKKLFALALAAMMLLTFAACGDDAGTSDTEPETNAVTEEATIPETDAPTDAPEVITSLDMEESVLVDDDNCAFKVSLASENAHLGMTLDAVCTNKTDKTLYFTWNTVSVCGYMYDPLWAEEVAPGKKVDSVIYIDTYELEQYGVTSADQIQFDLYIFDSEDFMAEPFVDETFTIYPTGLTAETYTAPERESVAGEQVIVDNEELTFIVESVSDNSDAYTLRCYLRNKTERDLMFSWEDAAVNGSTIDPVWSSEVAAGKQAYSEITFYREDLDAKAIETVEEITFRLAVSDWEDWEAGYILDEDCAFLAENSVVG